MNELILFVLLGAAAAACILAIRDRNEALLECRLKQECIEALERDTIKAQFKTMDELGAGHMAMILGKENGEAVKAAVFLTGKGTQEILDGIERIYDRQDAALRREEER